MLTCTFEDGGTAALRHITLTAILVQDGKILLAKRAPHLSEGGKWCLPGGYMDRDETTIEGIRREVREETGYDSHVLSLVRIIDRPDRPREDRQNVEFTFVVQPLKKISDTDKETSELQWFALDKIPPEAEMAFDHWESVAIYLRQKNGEEISLLGL